MEGGEGQRAHRRDTEVPCQPQHRAPAWGRDRGKAGNARVALREGSPGLRLGRARVRAVGLRAKPMMTLGQCFWK